MASETASLTAGMSPEQILQQKDQNHDAEVYVCAAVFTILAIFAVSVRVTSRHMKKVTFGIDDYLVIIALVIATAQTIFICVGVPRYGVGRHIWTLTADQIVAFNKLWYTVGTLQCTSLMLTKLSLLMLYHHIFVTPAFRTTTKIIGVVVVLWWVGTILAGALVCLPVKHGFNPAVPGHCGNMQLLAILPPIPWIVTDLVILLMPMPMVWNLHLPRLQRAGLAGLFLLGGFAIVASCVRYTTLFYQHDDVTYYVIPATVWTIVETDVTIVSACLIVSRPFFAQLWPSTLISRIREGSFSHRRSSKRTLSTQSGGRKGVSSSFARLTESPRVVDASIGAPFDYDIEKDVVLDSPIAHNAAHIVTVRGGMEVSLANQLSIFKASHFVGGEFVTRQT